MPETPRCTVQGREPVNPNSAPVPDSATKPDGQHVDHWVMCPGEIIKAGFVRPVRSSYIHKGIPGPKFPLQDLTHEQKKLTGNEYAKFEPYPKDYRGSALGKYWSQADIDRVGKGCGTKTSMPRAIAETYAAQPGYYGSTFCCGCGTYLPVGQFGEFTWDGTDDRVGT